MIPLTLIGTGVVLWFVVFRPLLPKRLPPMYINDPADYSHPLPLALRQADRKRRRPRWPRW